MRLVAGRQPTDGSAHRRISTDSTRHAPERRAFMNGYANSFYMPLPKGNEASFYYQQRQLAHKAAKPTKDLSVAAIADVDNLAAVFEQMKRENGPAPGP